MYERSERILSLKILMKYSDLFRVSTDYILGTQKNNSEVEGHITINIYGRVSASIPIEAIEYIQDTEQLSIKGYQFLWDYLGLIVDMTPCIPNT